MKIRPPSSRKIFIFFILKSFHVLFPRLPFTESLQPDEDASPLCVSLRDSTFSAVILDQTVNSIMYLPEGIPIVDLKPVSSSKSLRYIPHIHILHCLLHLLFWTPHYPCSGGTNPIPCNAYVPYRLLVLTR